MINIRNYLTYTVQMREKDCIFSNPCTPSVQSPSLGKKDVDDSHHRHSLPMASAGRSKLSCHWSRSWEPFSESTLSRLVPLWCVANKYFWILAGDKYSLCLQTFKGWKSQTKADMSSASSLFRALRQEKTTVKTTLSESELLLDSNTSLFMTIQQTSCSSKRLHLRMTGHSCLRTALGKRITAKTRMHTRSA